MTKKVLEAVYNKYPANIAIVDGDGVIQSVNCAWKHYAGSNGGDSDASWAGVSYLQICESSAREDHTDARTMLAGFDRVISKKIDQFQYLYPCHSPIQQSWYLARIVPLEVGSDTLYMIAHEDRSVDVLMRQALEKGIDADGITGLANQRGFRKLLSREWRRDRRHKHEMSMLVIGVDDLKMYHDEHGDAMRDQCLVQVTRAINAVIRRPGDYAAKVAEDEFAVLLGNTAQPDAMAIAERLRSNIELIAIPHCQSALTSVVTVSIGVASMTPHRHLTTSMLMNKANDAYYRASVMGRNLVSF